MYRQIRFYSPITIEVLTLELINTFGISPEQVVIEITEHSPTHDYELMRRAVKHYQAEGFSIALDDLGSWVFKLTSLV